MSIGRQSEQRRREHRKRDQDQDRGDQDVPGEDRETPHRHAGGAQADHRGDHVDAAQDGAQAGDGQTHDPQVATRTRGVHRVGQRGVGGPTERGGTTRGEKARHGNAGAEKVEPVGKGVQPRKRDVRSTDLQRQDEVGEAEHDGGCVEQQHDRAVHGEQLVVLLVGQELHARTGKFGAHDQRHHTADHEEEERGDHVHLAERLRIRGLQISQQRDSGSEFVDRVRPAHNGAWGYGSHGGPPAVRRTGVTAAPIGRTGDEDELSPTSRRRRCRGTTTRGCIVSAPPRRPGPLADRPPPALARSPDPCPPHTFGPASRVRWGRSRGPAGRVRRASRRRTDLR